MSLSAKQSPPKNRSSQQHLPLDALVLTDLHDFPLDPARLAQMQEDFANGAPWAWHPLAVTKTATRHVILDGRLRALVRQRAGQMTAPCYVYDLVEEEWAAFRWAGRKNRHTHPTEVAP